MNEQMFSVLVSNLYEGSKVIKLLHWNFTGKRFYPLHPQLDDLYNLMLDSADTIAEIGRQLNFVVNPFISTIQKPEALLVEAEEVITTSVMVMEGLNEQIMSLRNSITNSGMQSSFDAIIDSFNIEIWKWSMMIEIEDEGEVSV